MSDLTERAGEVVRSALVKSNSVSVSRLIGGRLAVVTLDAAGMLTDPDVEDPRITAARALTEEWDRQARCARADAVAVDRAEPGSTTNHAALVREARVTGDHAAALRRVLDGDPDTTGDDE